MHTAKLAASLLVLLALMLDSAPARAETVNCTPVTALPAVITVPGIHCFTANLATNITSGNAIEIQTNNVVLDLNGFKLGGPASLGTQAVGIQASGRQNITVKNGTINGFRTGILLQDATGTSRGHIVEDIRADQNTQHGMDIAGAGSIVRNNQVVATGGSTIVPNSNAIGIEVRGSGPRVLNNDVVNTVGGGTGTASGIRFSGVTGGLAVNNRITKADKGIEYAGAATGKYRDNLTFGVTTPFTGGTAVGTNN